MGENVTCLFLSSLRAPNTNWHKSKLAGAWQSPDLETKRSIQNDSSLWIYSHWVIAGDCHAPRKCFLMLTRIGGLAMTLRNEPYYFSPCWRRCVCLQKLFSMTKGKCKPTSRLLRDRYRQLRMGKHTCASVCDDQYIFFSKKSRKPGVGCSVILIHCFYFLFGQAKKPGGIIK